MLSSKIVRPSSSPGLCRTRHWAARRAQPKTAENTGVRINKCLKHKYSRRQVDQLILEQRIQINGQTAQHGDRLAAGDVVLCDGKRVNWEKMNDLSQAQNEFVYIKYWKPVGEVVTTDARDRRNVLDSIRHPKRVYPIGRLDRDTSGLLLLTNDGRLVNALLRAANKHTKWYRVTVNKPLNSGVLQQLQDGVVIETKVQRDRQHKVHIAKTHPCKVKKVDAFTFKIALQQGRNRQIRRMCEAVGREVVTLHRFSMAGLELKPLKPGCWCALSSREMNVVYEALQSAQRQEGLQKQHA